MKEQHNNRPPMVSEQEESRWSANTAAAALLEAIPLGIHECDTEGRITRVNSAQAAITGYSPEELLGAYVWQRIAPGPIRDALPAYLQRLVVEQPPATPFFASNVRKNGALFDVRVDWNYQRDPQGQVTGFICVVSDITAQRRAEKTLRESERRFRSLFQDSAVGAIVVSPQGRFLQVNREFCEFLGYTEQELLGQTVLSITHPDDREISSRAIEQAVHAGPRIERLEKRYLHKSGAIRWGEISSNLILDADGNPDYLIAQVLDVTERKAAEAALQRAHGELEQRVLQRTAELSREIEERKQIQAALAESEAKYRLLVETTGTGYLILDSQGHVLDANAEYVRLSGGRSLEDILGRNVREWTAPHDVQRNAQELQECLRKGSIRQLEVDYLHADGQVLPVEINATCVETKSGLRIVSLCRDISKRKRAERLLRESEENLRAFFNTIEDVLFVVDQAGAILWANKTALTRLAYREDELLGRNVLGVHPEDRRHEAGEVVARMVAGKEATCSVPLVTKDGRLISVETRVVQGRWNGRAVLFGVSRDISELRASQERFAKAFDCNPSPMAISSLGDGRFLEVNAAFLQTLNYRREEVVGAAISEINVFDDLQRRAAALEIIRETGNLRDFAAAVRTKDGRVRQGLFAAEIIQLQDQQVLLTVMNDVTERQKAQAALERERQSLWRMLQASDHERQIISYEIHDGLAQYLAAAGMQFQAHDSLRASSPAEARKAYQTALELVRQAHFESRRLINEVRPPVIDETGIETAISHLVFEQRRHGGPTIECHTSVQFGRLPSILENALYRITQEALTNACRHSQSKKVTVTLLQEGPDIRLEIRDWGVGFNPEAYEKGHFGLEGIRQRVRLLGGRLTIESSPHAGTLLQVLVPILENQSEP